MPTKNPRTMITFNDKELFEQVNSYRFERRFKSQNDAVMDLINKGIEVLAGETPGEPTIQLTEEDVRFIRAYRNALPVIKNAALTMLENNPA